MKSFLRCIRPLLFLSVGTVSCALAPDSARVVENLILAATVTLRADRGEDNIPKGYTKQLIELAKEPTPVLREAFRTLDLSRYPGHRGERPNDGVWLTGTLITILAFDCPPVSSRDYEN